MGVAECCRRCRAFHGTPLAKRMRLQCLVSSRGQNPKTLGIPHALHGLCIANHSFHCLAIATESLGQQPTATNCCAFGKTLGIRLDPVKYMLLPSKSHIRCSKRGRAHTAGIQVRMEPSAVDHVEMLLSACRQTTQDITKTFACITLQVGCGWVAPVQPGCCSSRAQRSPSDAVSAPCSSSSPPAQWQQQSREQPCSRPARPARGGLCIAAAAAALPVLPTWLSPSAEKHRFTSAARSTVGVPCCLSSQHQLFCHNTLCPTAPLMSCSRGVVCD